MSLPTSLLQVSNLNLAYRHGDGWIRVLQDVSFTIARGESFGLVGESGSGKSSVAYQLLGYHHPRSRILSGEVMLEGRDLLQLQRKELDRIRGSRIGFVPQNPTTALSPGMRVGQQVAEVLVKHGVASTQRGAGKRVAELFAHVGLPSPNSLIHRYPHELSGGQQQRVLIAMALSCEPDLVVLDEPTTGLDVTTQEQIIELLDDLRAQHQMSMLYVTHDLSVLSLIADRVGVMYAGRIVETGPTSELFKHPRHPYTQGLVASIPRLELNGEHRSPIRGVLKREELPAGCAFYPRCDFAEPSCATNKQIMDRVSENHMVACQEWRTIGLAASEPEREEGGIPPDIARTLPLISLDRVSLGYREQGGVISRMGGHKPSPVVHEVSFAIGPGSVFALVGESGSGKSTIARAIAGLLAPLAGTTMFEGHPLPAAIRHRSRDLRRQIQFIFQNPDASLNPRMRVGEILARPLKVFFEFNSGRNPRAGHARLGRRAARSLLSFAISRSALRRGAPADRYCTSFSK